MATVRPQLTVFKVDGTASGSVATPAVFSAPIRKDIVSFIYTNISKNARQPYAVNEMAGMQHSAESWGTGRAVARIPRVGGGGTGRSGQAAFGNMCRKGRLWAPTKIWRKWQRKTNLKQRRQALASAIAASTVTALVQARGHRVEKLPELPLVLDDSVESVSKTKNAVAILKAVGAYEDVKKSIASRKARTGIAHLRNRHHRVRKGPLVVYGEDKGIARAFRNLPGVDLVQASRLNLLTLAPGGHLGRFVIWTKSAVEIAAKNYNKHAAQAIVATADLNRLINSDELQGAIRGKITYVKRAEKKVNALTNFNARLRLNPLAGYARKTAAIQNVKNAAARKARLEAARKGEVKVDQAYVEKRIAAKQAAYERMSA